MSRTTEPTDNPRVSEMLNLIARECMPSKSHARVNLLSIELGKALNDLVEKDGRW